MGNMCETDQKPNPALQSSVHIKNVQLAAPEKQPIVQQQTITTSPMEEVKKEEPEQTKTETESTKTIEPPIQTKEQSQEQKKPLELSDFVMLNQLGRGAFGKVFKVRKRDDNKIYAMKQIAKKLIVEHKLEQNTVLEKDVLKTSKHPFIVELKYAFQTPSSLYFVMECVTGGEFYKILQSTQGLPDNIVRFVTAEIVLALEHLNVKLRVIYRDLKPENILLTVDGHVKLTDFGLATMKKENEKTFTLAGTPEYLAPEIISRIGHSSEVDLWTLGILIYEMLNGYPPFQHPDRNIQKIQQQILSNKPVYPDSMSSEAKDIVQRLLRTDPKERLGANGYHELKAHPFFNGVKWNELLNMTQKSPLAHYAKQNSQKQDKQKKLPEKPIQETPCQAGPAFQGISYNPEGMDETLRDRKLD